HTALEIRVDVTDLWVAGAWRPAPGGLLARAGRFTPVHQGDRISASGVLQEPPILRDLPLFTPCTPALPASQDLQDFDYRAFLLRQDLGSYMRQARVQVLAADANPGPLSALDGARRAAGARLVRALPEPQAGLLSGIVLGDGHALDPALRDEF